MRYALLASLIPAVLGGSNVVRASPGRSPLRPLVATQLPARCRPLAVVPPSARSSDPDLAAHVSVANCLAEEAMAGLVLGPDPASIAALDAAAAPSLAILDDVLEHGDVRWEPVADAAKADLFYGMVVRLRIATEQGDGGALEARLVPWLDQASQADLRRERAVARRLEHDRDMRDAARAEVAADTHLLDVEHDRVTALRAAWDRAVADHRADQAGQLAPLHHDALMDDLAARAQLGRAQQSLHVQEGVLAADRRQLRTLQARAESLNERS